MRKLIAIAFLSLTLAGCAGESATERQQKVNDDAHVLDSCHVSDDGSRYVCDD